MPELRTHKLDVARRLLDRAAVLLLDVDDAISAFVLAGSAEDILEGLLGLEGRQAEAARPTMARHSADVWAALDPNETPLSHEELVAVIRAPFNWARHADRKTDPAEIERDWHDEAVWALDRAVHNLQALTGELHPRATDIALRTIGRA